MKFSAKDKAAFVLISLFLISASAFLSGSYQSALPSPNIVKPFKNSFSEDMIAANFGARRIFADLWFVRLMQYYGTREKLDNPLKNFGSGEYPDFYPLAAHIIGLDPYFKSAVLYSAASMAFNLNRPEKAIALLNFALEYLPKEWKYLSMLAAIGYGKNANSKKLAAVFIPFIKEPDCPTMIKQLAAFLNKKVGDYRRAYMIYLNIAGTSKDEAYVKNAKKQIMKLKTLMDEKNENSQNR